MIGALPAVAVRHERRRNDKRRRPSQLALQMGRQGDQDPTPSPDHHGLRNDIYVCFKVAALHAVVGALLLGIVVLVVGLVQLSPGAEAAQHRFYLLGSGGALIGAGVFGGVLRCLCLHWFHRQFQAEEEEELEAAHKHSVSVVESHHHHQEHKSHSHKTHEHKAHDTKAAEIKTGDTKAADNKAVEIKAPDNKATDPKGTDKPKLKTQASRDVETVVKQPSATSDA